MAFDAAERALVLGAKGDGPTVASRLGQLGYDSLSQLADAGTADITVQVAAMLDTTCWRDSPQTRAAITAAIDVAKRHRGAA